MLLPDMKCFRHGLLCLKFMTLKCYVSEDIDNILIFKYEVLGA